LQYCTDEVYSVVFHAMRFLQRKFKPVICKIKFKLVIRLNFLWVSVYDPISCTGIVSVPTQNLQRNE